ncbi:hypothetical protein BD413DRAFT_490599 [Trametes elegans]|nr:hypothetical protein BD413DRAFT_490599 [Trametes elegans]
MQAPNFETFISSDNELQSCFLNASLISGRCEQGSVPVIGVDARTVGDIQSAVMFAAEHNLRLVVKNTGHDYLGRSSGRDSFMIWTHHLKTITSQDEFRPQGAPTEGDAFEHALTLHAGVQWHEAYAAADAAGRILAGGFSDGGSVGAAGGWLLGGGHSLALSPTYGLGVDNTLEISIVTADGAHLVTNAYQHSDLFWALRGGGGGTFGVVTSVTYRTHPAAPVNMAVITARRVRGGVYLESAPDNNTFSFALLAFVPNVSLAEANHTIIPYLDYVQALAMNSTGEKGVLAVQTALTKQFPSYPEALSAVLPESGQVGQNIELGSWLLPRDVLEIDREHVAETLLEITGTSGLSYEFIGGGAVSKVNASSAGLNPAWRKALVHTILGTSWPDGTSPTEIQQLREKLQNSTAAVRALAPDSGAYFNEAKRAPGSGLIHAGQASMFEPDPPKAFFGAHYPALQAIKKVYDPTDLFLVREGVGADAWDDELTCARS